MSLVTETKNNYMNYKVDFVFQSKYIVHKGTMKFISEENLNRVGTKKPPKKMFLMCILIHT